MNILTASYVVACMRMCWSPRPRPGRHIQAVGLRVHLAEYRSVPDAVCDFAFV